MSESTYDSEHAAASPGARKKSSLTKNLDSAPAAEGASRDEAWRALTRERKILAHVARQDDGRVAVLFFGVPLDQDQVREMQRRGEKVFSLKLVTNDDDLLEQWLAGQVPAADLPEVRGWPIRVCMELEAQLPRAIPPDRPPPGLLPHRIRIEAARGDDARITVSLDGRPLDLDDVRWLKGDDGFLIETNDEELLTEWLDTPILRREPEPEPKLAAAPKPEPYYEPPPPIWIDLECGADGRVTGAHNEYGPVSKLDILRIKCTGRVVECIAPGALDQWLSEPLQEIFDHPDGDPEIVIAEPAEDKLPKKKKKKTRQPKATPAPPEPEPAAAPPGGEAVDLPEIKIWLRPIPATLAGRRAAMAAGMKARAAGMKARQPKAAAASSGAVEAPPAADAAEPAPEEPAPEPKPRLEPGIDELTLLRVDPGRRATKTILPSRVLEYDAGMWFRVETIRVDGLKRLAHVAQHLEAKAKWFAIRARLIEGRDPARVMRRKCGADPYFEPHPRHHVALDFDGVELNPKDDPLDVFDVAFAAISHLPDEFQKAACHATLTSGAGLKPGGRVRLWYWLDRPLAGYDLKRWLYDVPYLDRATLEDVQPIYTAAPVVAPGAVDPLGGKERSATIWMDEILDDLEPAVRVPGQLAEPRPCSTGLYGGPNVTSDGPGTPGSKVTIPALRSRDHAKGYIRSVMFLLRAAPVGQGRGMFTRAALKIMAACLIVDADPEPAIAALRQIMVDRGWSPDETTRGNTLADIDRQIEWCRGMAGDVEVRV